MRDRVLRSFANLTWRHPWGVVVVGVLIAALSILYSATHLRLNADLDDLIAPSRPYMRGYRSFLEEFGDLESIWVVVEAGGDRARTEACVDLLEERLAGLDGIPAVHASIAPAEQLRIATRAMSESELEDLVRVAEAFPALRLGDPGTVLSDATARLAASQAVEDPAERDRLQDVALFELEVAAALLGGLGGTGDLERLAFPALTREYLRSATGRLYFVEIRAVKDFGTLAVIEEPLRAIREVLASVHQAYPDLEIGLTGKPVLQADEMRTTDADMIRATIGAVILVAGLFMVVIGGVVRPGLAVLSLLIGMAWTFGFATLAVGQLNLLSVVFTLILVGVGIDFGIHILTRYREEIAARGVQDAIETALLTSGRGNVTGAVTSSAAFFMTLFTDFQGLRELGIIAGSGLLLCLLAMTLVLPALLVIRDRGRAIVEPDRHAQPSRVFIAARRPLVWLGALGIVTLGLLPGLRHLGFEANVLELQAEGLASVEWEHRILEDSASAAWFGAVAAGSLAEVEDITRRAAEEEVIGVVYSVLDVIGPPTPRRAELRAAVRAAARAAPPETAAADEGTAMAAAARCAREGAGGDPDRARRFAEVAGRLEAIEEGLSGLGGTLIRGTAGVKAQLVASGIRALVEGDALPLRDALPAALRHRMMAPSGRFLVSLHPRENVWEIEAMDRYITAMRRVDPDVTGAPITHFESIADMKRGFRRASVLALIVVFALVMIDFRRLGPAVLAMVPLLVGFLWLLATMGLCGVRFNLANFFAVPILVGIGVDNGVHLVHRFRERGVHRHAFGSTHRGVCLTSATSFIGFGGLTLASHRGLQSLGEVMALGCVTCLFATLFVLVPLLRLVDRSPRGP